jgi:outer membrane receptor protein involved in Fe transport
MKRALLRGASAATLVVVGGLWASQALAQAAAPPPPPSPPAAAGDQTGSGQVIVTAQRRNQAIEHVPVAVSAFTAKQRDLLGIQTTQELSDFTPGLSYFASNDRAYIRGIGRNTVSLATESGVATYYNGVYYGANATIAEQHDSLFVSQIEVDRGPQNTLRKADARLLCGRPCRRAELRRSLRRGRGLRPDHRLAALPRRRQLFQRNRRLFQEPGQWQ